MIRLPKFGVPADEMMRQSLYQPTPAQSHRSISQCAGSSLYNPKIPSGIGQVDVVSGDSRQRMIDIIQNQRNTAEKTILKMRKDQQNKMSAPSGAMEEYYMAVLKDIRRKEQIEIEKAYLTQQQKDTLHESALAAKAGIDGDLVRRADELIEMDRDVDGIVMDASEKAFERESRKGITTKAGKTGAGADPSETFEEDEMDRKMRDQLTGRAGSKAVAASAAASSSSEVEGLNLVDFVKGLNTRISVGLKSAVGDDIINNPMSRKYLVENSSAILRDFQTLAEKLQEREVLSASNVEQYMKNMRAALNTGPGSVRNLLYKLTRKVRTKYSL